MVSLRSVLLWAAVMGAAACMDAPERPEQPESAGAPPLRDVDAARLPAAQDAGTIDLPACRSPEPPPIVMTGPAGQQQGAPGSFCAAAGGGPRCGLLCADRGFDVHESMIVHPGDEVTFSMPDGTLLSGECTPECPPVLRIYVQDCQGQYRQVQRAALIEDVPWRVTLPGGEYTVVADTHFMGQQGASGSTSAIFGLIVDAKRERGRAEAPRRIEDCKAVIAVFRDDSDAGI